VAQARRYRRRAISILVADVLLILYFERSYHYLHFRFAQFRPQTRIWNSLLRIGLPAGAEFILISVYIIIVYSIIRGFGAAAQAGFGVGARLIQALFLPVVALSVAVVPVVGQNFGGRRGDRVRHSICSALGISLVMMLLLTIVSQFSSAAMIRAFSRDPAVILESCLLILLRPELLLLPQALFRELVTPFDR
jgi:Na+-driven multidrug efflux pump